MRQFSKRASNASSYNPLLLFFPLRALRVFVVQEQSEERMAAARHEFTLSAFGDEIAADLGEQLSVMEREGVPALEFRGAWGQNILDLSDDDVRKAKQMLDERGMHVSAVGSPIGKVGITEDFGAHLERFRR